MSTRTDIKRKKIEAAMPELVKWGEVECLISLAAIAERLVADSTTTQFAYALAQTILDTIAILDLGSEQAELKKRTRN